MSLWSLPTHLPTFRCASRLFRSCWLDDGVGIARICLTCLLVGTAACDCLRILRFLRFLRTGSDASVHRSRELQRWRMQRVVALCRPVWHVVSGLPFSWTVCPNVCHMNHKMQMTWALDFRIHIPILKASTLNLGENGKLWSIDERVCYDVQQSSQIVAPKKQGYHVGLLSWAACELSLCVPSVDDGQQAKVASGRDSARVWLKCSDRTGCHWGFLVRTLGPILKYWNNQSDSPKGPKMSFREQVHGQIFMPFCYAFSLLEAYMMIFDAWTATNVTASYVNRKSSANRKILEIRTEDDIVFGAARLV